MRTFALILIISFSLQAFSQSAFIRTYGENDFNYGKGILALPDTTYIICGNTSNIGNKGSIWIFRINNSGEILWQQSLNDFASQNVEDIAWINDSSFAVCGTALQNSDYEFNIAKLDINGNLLWNKTFGDAAWNIGSSIVADAADNLWFTGYSMPIDSFNTDAVIYQLDIKNGDSLNYKRFDVGYFDKGLYIDTSSEYSLLLTTQTTDTNTDSTISTIWKLDSNLDTIWTISFGNDTISYKLYSTLNVNQQRIYYAGSVLKSNSQDENAILGYISFDGYFLFEDIDDGTRLTYMNRAILGNDSIVYGIGSTVNGYFGNSDFGINCDSSGYYFFRYFGALQNDYAYDIVQSADNCLVMLGSTENFTNNASDIMLIKLGEHRTFNDTDVRHITSCNNNKLPENTLSIYPNPSVGKFHINSTTKIISVNIFDMFGKEIYFTDDKNMTEFDISTFPSGIYFLKVKTFTGNKIFKLILQ